MFFYCEAKGWRHVISGWAGAILPLLFSCLATTGNAANGPDDSVVLVGEWQLNEGSGEVVHDTSEHGHDGMLGTAAGALPTWLPDGPSIQFIGGQGYVHVPSDDVFATPHVSVEFWIKDGTGLLRYAMSLGNIRNPFSASTDSWGVWAGNGDKASCEGPSPEEKGICFYVHTSGGGGYAPGVDTSVWDGRWHHFVGTYDGAFVRAYLDGREVGNGTPTSGDIVYGPNTQNDFWIGSNIGNGGSTSEVKIRNVRIYSGALTATRIASAAQRGVTPYNRPYGIATHNSYWINRSDQVDLYSSGTQELLSDQLLHEHVRAIEIDVHSEGAPDHQWKVYHTSDSEDFQCRFLTDCLDYLRNFHYAVPSHDVINVIIELKNTVPTTGVASAFIPTHGNFDSKHTMEDFDAIFRDSLGTALYTPGEFLSHCPAGTTMRECSKQSNSWPTIDQLRGRFIINIIGNWSTAGYDWAQYASQNLASHVAFPIQTMLGINVGGCQGGLGDPNLPAPTSTTIANFDGMELCVRDIVDTVDPSPYVEPGVRQAAFDGSVFWQLEDLDPPALDAAQRFLRVYNGVIRGRDSFEYFPDCENDSDSVNCQEQRIGAGFQLIQTDYPWHFVNDLAWSTLHIPTDPSQRLKDPASLPKNGVVGQFSAFNESGSRIYFQSSPVYPGAWAFADAPKVSSRWLETTVSSTRRGDTWGEYTNVLVLNDYIRTCPGPSPEADNGCTNYPRPALEDGEGCIKVTADSGGDGMEICRQKKTTPGASFYQEGVDLYVRVLRGGRVVTDKEFVGGRYAPCKTSMDPNSEDVSSICVGSMLAVAVVNAGASSQVTVYSAGRLEPLSGTRSPLPQWNALDTESFDLPMTKQGYRGWKSELMVGLRRADALIPMGTNDWRPDPTRLRAISLSDLPMREMDPDSRVVDLSY